MKPSIIIVIVVTILLFGAWWLPVVFGESSVASPGEVSKDLIVLRGTDAIDLLEYPSYQIIASNVNFDKVGNYYVYYRSSNNVELVKRVIVLEEKATSYYQEKVYTSSTSSASYEEIDASCTIDEERYAYAYNLKQKEGGFSGRNLFLNIMVRDKLKVSIQLLYNSAAVVRDLACDGEKVVGTGWKKDPYGNYLIWLFIVDLKTETVKHFYYGSGGDSFSESVLVANDSYYLAGSTVSEVEPFMGKRKANDSFLLKIDKITKEITQVNTFNVNGNDTISHLASLDNYLYLTQISGENLESLTLLKLDFFFNELAIKDFNSNYPVLTKDFWVGGDGKLYLWLNQFDYRLQKDVDSLYRIDGSLNYALDYNAENNDYALIDVKINEKGIKTFLYFDEVKGVNKIEEFDAGTLINSLPLTKDNFSAYRLEGTNRHLVIGINQVKSISEVVLFDIIKIKQGTTKLLNEHSKIDDYEITINNDRVIHDSLSKIDYNPDVFGLYPGRLHFSTPSLDFCYSVTFEVLPSISVSNGETYDKNLKLTFNGTATLNNHPITNNYLIQEAGDYLLEVTGKEHKVKLIQFKVRGLSLQAEPSEEKVNYSAELGNIDQSKDEKNIELSLTQRNDDESIGQIKEAGLYFLPVCVGLAGFLLLMKVN